MFLIGVSCSAFCVETLPQYHKKNGDFWAQLEMVCVLIFSLEFALRSSTTPTPKHFVFEFLINLIALTYLPRAHDPRGLPIPFLMKLYRPE